MARNASLPWEGFVKEQNKTDGAGTMIECPCQVQITFKINSLVSRPLFCYQRGHE